MVVLYAELEYWLHAVAGRNRKAEVVLPSSAAWLFILEQQTTSRSTHTAPTA
jgi:hypothetical protein